MGRDATAPAGQRFRGDFVQREFFRARWLDRNPGMKAEVAPPSYTAGAVDLNHGFGSYCRIRCKIYPMPHASADPADGNGGRHKGPDGAPGTRRLARSPFAYARGRRLRDVCAPGFPPIEMCHTPIPFEAFWGCLYGLA